MRNSSDPDPWAVWGWNSKLWSEQGWHLKCVVIIGLATTGIPTYAPHAIRFVCFQEWDALTSIKGCTWFFNCFLAAIINSNVFSDSKYWHCGRLTFLSKAVVMIIHKELAVFVFSQTPKIFQKYLFHAWLVSWQHLPILLTILLWGFCKTFYFLCALPKTFFSCKSQDWCFE